MAFACFGRRASQKSLPNDSTIGRISTEDKASTVTIVTILLTVQHVKPLCVLQCEGGCRGMHIIAYWLCPKQS